MSKITTPSTVLMEVETIHYGTTSECAVDVFPLVKSRMERDRQTLLFLPGSDEARLAFFQPLQDPCPKQQKQLIVNHKVDFPAKELLFLVWNDQENRFFFGKWNRHDAKSHIVDIHRHLTLLHGDSMDDELPEQMIINSFLLASLSSYRGDYLSVLELGGNVGRATLMTKRTLSTIFGVNEPRPLLTQVVMETFPSIAEKLRLNLHVNQMFHEVQVVEASLNDADKFGLIQTGWDIQSYDLNNRLDAFNFQNLKKQIADPNSRTYRSEVASISYSDLKQRYFVQNASPPMIWIVDCEGFFFSILQQYPECLSDMEMLIIENDFATIEQKKVVDQQLLQNQFLRIVSFPGGLSTHVCKQDFHEVWIRRNSSVHETLCRNCSQPSVLAQIPGFEFVHIESSTRFAGSKFRAESKLTTNLFKEKKEIVHDSENHNHSALTMNHIEEYHQYICEIDFAASDNDSETVREHEFLVYSIAGCTNCDQFMEDASEMKEKIGKDASIRVRKVDVTAKVRNNQAGKEQFAKYITDCFQYKGYKAAGAHGKDAKIYFPIIIYNDKYIGDAVSGNKKLSKIVDDLVDYDI